MTTGLSRSHPYAAESYVAALGLGRPVNVPAWGGAVAARPIPEGGEDGFGSYPLTVFPGGADLEGGLIQLKHDGFVSIALVPDPLSGPRPETFKCLFGLHRTFKSHLLIDPDAGPYAPSKHHRDRIRRARRRCRVERTPLADHLDDWKTLYAGLVEHRAVTGPAAFPAAYFDSLAGDPRIEAFAAFINEELAAMTLWLEHAGVVYNHLTASNALGYANGASFALYDAAIERFGEAGVINLGGGAGLTNDPDDGLAAFKRGFANSQVQAYFCGAILDEGRYAELSAGRKTDFFPAYRG